MKNTLAIALITLIPSLGFADLGKKEPLKVDFHNMIVNSYHERAALATDVSKDEKNNQAQADAKRVTDFVDIEIGCGEAPKMVDRRFDSVESNTDKH